ncbi:GNAT family N-acetyltransferase [Bacillus safensis]|uniref:GNAT family N-acetyltransferase n=1 Tax=Bacillus safensis TaxID=561879 RepID=UPI0018CC9210|nr:GNAT family N-acetyltransferase [Bacillus safensis]MBG9817698.1 GNAT family acetyltransferase [Bacillus safensis]
MNTIIRQANQKDIKRIREVAEITWNYTYKELIPEEIQDRFLKKAYSDEALEKRVEGSLFLVAQKGEEIVSFANFFYKDENAELAAIYLLPELQGLGIGTQLLNEGVFKLEKKTKRLYVDVEKGNKSGENFYKSKGFRVVKEFEDNFLGHNLKTVQLVLEFKNEMKFNL